MGIMNTLNVSDKKTLFVVPEYNETLYLSSRNIPNAATALLSDVNTYEIVNADMVVLTESAAKIFNEEEASA
jgi:large subunit ribosomal protein L4